MQKMSALSCPHPFWSTISFGRHVFKVAKEHYSYLDKQRKNSVKNSLLSLITAVGVQIGLYTARYALTKFTPENWRWKITLGFFLLHDYYLLDFFKPFLILQDTNHLLREIKKNTLITNFSEKEFEVLQTFHFYMHKNPGNVIDGHALAKAIQEISNSDFVQRMGQLQRMPLSGHRINGKAFQNYGDFLLHFWNSEDLIDALMTYQTFCAFSKLLMSKGVIEELAEAIKLKQLGSSKELSDNEIITLRTLRDNLTNTNNLDLLDHLEDFQKFKDQLELCKRYEIKHKPDSIGKVITISEYLKEYKSLKRLEKNSTSIFP